MIPWGLLKARVRFSLFYVLQASESILEFSLPALP